jgi:hypothetical protein
MNPEIKAQWVAALRSGEYVQGRSSLHYLVDENGNAKFCCLGVLCDLAVKAGGVVEEVDTPEEGREGVVYYDGDQSFPPPSVVVWAGIQDQYGRVPGSLDDEGSLYQLNDAGTSFADIADVIENRY